MPPIAPLADRIPPRGTTDADEILGLFLDWVSASGLTLYPAQEEALLEIMAGKHVILATPTGSGKSLVALGLHFKAVCEGRVSFYTSPIKALASEKFFGVRSRPSPPRTVPCRSTTSTAKRRSTRRSRTSSRRGRDASLRAACRKAGVSLRW